MYGDWLIEWAKLMDEKKFVEAAALWEANSIQRMLDRSRGG